MAPAIAKDGALLVADDTGGTILAHPSILALRSNRQRPRAPTGWTPAVERGSALEDLK